MSFSAVEKIRFLLDFSFISLHFGKLCWVEEFLLGEDKLEHGTEFFFNHSTNSCKDSRIKAAGKFVLPYGQVLQFTIN